MNTHDKIELPPLPEWSKMDNLGGLVPSEIRQALAVYARAAIEADRKRRGEPVGFVSDMDMEDGKIRTGTPVFFDRNGLGYKKTPVYATPQPAEHQECGCCGRSNGCDPDCDAAQPAEPVKILGRNPTTVIMEEVNPVKVPSDLDILEIWQEFRDYQPDWIRKFARALLARYGKGAGGAA